MTTSILIAGYGPNDKVPGPVTGVTYGVGGGSPGATTLKMLLVALKSAAGSATVDTEVFAVPRIDAAVTKAGPGSEFHRAAMLALRRNVQLFGICPAQSAPTAADITVTVSGTWTTAGSWMLRIDGETISGGITAGMNKVAVAAAIVATITGKPNLPVSGAVGVSAGVNDNIATLTFKSTGVRGKRSILWIVSDDLPSGCTMAATGGSTVTGGGTFFTTGAGVEDVSNVISTIQNGTYDYIAIAQNDSTNLGRWRTFADAQAAPFVEKPSFFVMAMNDALATVASRSQNDLNDPLFQVAWQLNAETHPTSIAAALCALRCETEQAQPNSDYDDVELLGVVPTTAKAAADIADRSTKQTALDEGVTPLYTTTDGRVRVTRSITALSLANSVPYYGTLDTYEAVVPQVVRKRLKARWYAHRQVNRFLRDNPSRSEPTPPQGVTTPARWNGEMTSELKDCERDLLITGVVAGTYVPRTEFDPVANRFMSEAPIKVLKHNHAIGISVLQVAS